VKFLQTLFGCLGLGLLLSGCAVYDSVFHPHRLPTPPMSATAKAKAKAAEKARHKGVTLKQEEAITDGASGADPAAAGAAAPADKPKTVSYNELPEGTKLTYNKQGLLKKSKLTRMSIDRRRLHRYDTRPLAPREASRENRRLRKKGSKGGGNNARDKTTPLMDAPTRPTPDEGMREPLPPAPNSDLTQPAKAAKSEKTEEPSQVKEEKTKRSKKAKQAPVPKPDPTQPQPFKGDQ
jgi:hypothetical protein